MNTIFLKIKELFSNKALQIPLLILMALPIILVIVFKVRLWKPKKAFRRARARYSNYTTRRRTRRRR